MEHRSLSFKYWIEFDEDGEIKAFHKNKYSCESECNEYVVKLIPIQRSADKEIAEGIDKFSKEITHQYKLLDSELKKSIKIIKGVLK